MCWENLNMRMKESEEDKRELHLPTIYGKGIDTTIEKKIDSFLLRRLNVMLNMNEKISLCTSDNPLAFGNSSRLSEFAYSNPGAIIHFPLNINELLCSFDPNFEKRNNKEVLKRNEIHAVNIT